MSISTLPNGRIDMFTLPSKLLYAAFILASISLPSAHSQIAGTAASRLDTGSESAPKKFQGDDVGTDFTGLIEQVAYRGGSRSSHRGGSRSGYRGGGRSVHRTAYRGGYRGGVAYR